MVREIKNVAFIVSLSMAASLRRSPARAGTFHDSCHAAQGHNKQGTL